MLATLLALSLVSAPANDPNAPMSVVLVEHASTYYSSNGVPLQTTTWTQWQGYRGATKISEEELFTSAGFDVEARNARSFESTNKALFWGGLIVAVVGLGLIAADPDDNAAVGAVAGTAGTIPLLIGSWRMTNNSAPAATAQHAASDYNSRLVRQASSSAPRQSSACVVGRSGCY